LRLAMSLLVRDEADIIAANIRFHAKLGVQLFIVTDNGSVDGTRELLDDLSKEVDIIIIDEPAHTIDQDLWVTRMAHHIQQHGSADWIINNDADEFWLPLSGNLVDAIEHQLHTGELAAQEVGLLYCQRSNLIPTSEAVNASGYSFADNVYRVQRTLTHTIEPDAAWHENGSDILIRTLPGKVITRMAGLISIDMGNHGAKHELARVNTEHIQILHFPVRRFEQFERKVINYGQSLENNTRFAQNVSRHLRHWYAQHLNGRLREEYDRFVLPQSRVQALVTDGILVQDQRLQQWQESDDDSQTPHLRLTGS